MGVALNEWVSDGCWIILWRTHKAAVSLSKQNVQLLIFSLSLQQTVPAWNTVFLLSAVFNLVFCTVFLVFGTDKVQPWNYPKPKKERWVYTSILVQGQDHEMKSSVFFPHFIFDLFFFKVSLLPSWFLLALRLCVRSEPIPVVFLLIGEKKKLILSLN